MRRLDGKPSNCKFRDLTGIRFGMLIALFTPSRKVGERRFWMCRCDCGVEKLVKAHNLTSGETNSCGCAKLEACKANIRIAHKKAVKEGTAFRQLLANYKHHAKQRGFVWELTDEQFKGITSSPCYYTEHIPSSEIKAMSGEVYIYNGVDRLDNAKGYTTENSVPCCGEVNMMKKALSKEHFIELCKKIAERF